LTYLDGIMQDPRFTRFYKTYWRLGVVILMTAINHSLYAQGGFFAGFHYASSELYMGMEYKKYTPRGADLGIEGGWWGGLIGGELGFSFANLHDDFVTSETPTTFKVDYKKISGGVILPFFTDFTYLRGGLLLFMPKGRFAPQGQAFDQITRGLLEQIEKKSVGYYVGIGAKFDLSVWQLYAQGTLYKPSEVGLFEWAFGLRRFF
jgi:hypothetical protein